MTRSQTSYDDAPQWQNGDPHAPLLDTLKTRVSEALDQEVPDALEKVLADAKALCDRTDSQPTDETKPTRENVRKMFAEIRPEFSNDDLPPAVKQLEELIQWERRPKARAAHAINEKPPSSLLTAAGQDGPLLTAGMVATLSGAGGTGKSKLALQIALQFAAANEGDPTWTTPDELWQTTAGPVLVSTYEDAPETTAERLRQQADRLNCPDARKRVHVLDLTGWPLFGPDEGNSYNSRPIRLKGWDILAEEADRIQPRLVVIDPALCAYVGEANAVAPVREFVAALAQFADQHNAAMLLVAHSTKAARSANDPFDAGQVSGSAAWHDAARACLVLTRDGDRWTLGISKANYGPAFIQAQLAQEGPAFRPVDSPTWKGKDGQTATEPDFMKD